MKSRTHVVSSLIVEEIMQSIITTLEIEVIDNHNNMVTLHVKVMHVSIISFFLEFPFSLPKSTTC